VARILAYITGSIDEELLLRNEYLATENRILKAQIRGRLLLSDAEKRTLAEIAYRLGRKALAAGVSRSHARCLPQTPRRRAQILLSTTRMSFLTTRPGCVATPRNNSLLLVLAPCHAPILTHPVHLSLSEFTNRRSFRRNLRHLLMRKGD